MTPKSTPPPGSGTWRGCPHNGGTPTSKGSMQCLTNRRSRSGMSANRSWAGPPGLVAAFLVSLLVVALLLAALFDVVLFPFSALFVVALLLVSLLVVALLLVSLLVVALVFASCFRVWFFKVVPAVCHCDPPFISRSESTPAGRSRVRGEGRCCPIRRARIPRCADQASRPQQ